MNDAQRDTLQRLATAFRRAIEQARVERDPAALPYFPDGACRMTSRLFAQHLARHSDRSSFGDMMLVSGALPGNSRARHYWLECDGAIVDLTADPFGQPPVVVGPSTPFHRSLSECITQPADEALTALSADETARLARQLAAIEARLLPFEPPAT